MSSKKVAMILCVCFIMGLMTFTSAQVKTIVFVSRPNYIDTATNEHADQPFIDELEDLGYDVITFYNTALELASPVTLDTLNSADLVIIGRSGSSTDFQDPHKEAWNAVTAPVLLLHLWAARSSRLNWFNSGDCVHYDEIDYVMDAYIEEPDDPVFAGISTNEVGWCIGPYDVINIFEAGNGFLLATSSDDGTVQFARFDPDFVA